MNGFEKLCQLASGEQWCWNLACSTCGQMHFRQAFAQLALGKSPLDPDWTVSKNASSDNKQAWLAPLRFTHEQKHEILKLCRQSNLAVIAMNCKFPDWLGYLGLVLDFMNTSEQEFQDLSFAWASQLSEFIPSTSNADGRLSEVLRGTRVLNLQDLAACETAILQNGMSR